MPIIVRSLCLLAGASCVAGAADQSSSASGDATVIVPTGAGAPGDDWLAAWQSRVHAAEDSQPHWMTPLAMGTGLLEQQVTYDQIEEHQLNKGGYVSRFDSGRGLEFIPTTTNEVIVDMPAYVVRHVTKPSEGFDDWTFLTVKQRLLSANEEHGN